VLILNLLSFLYSLLYSYFRIFEFSNFRIFLFSYLEFSHSRILASLFSSSSPFYLCISYRPNEDLVRITMEVPNLGKSVIEFRFPPNSNYPNEFPILFFKNNNIPPKHRRKIQEKMVEECKLNFLGSAMIYSLTLFLTTNLPHIDKLEEISSPFLKQSPIPASLSTLSPYSKSTKDFDKPTKPKDIVFQKKGVEQDRGRKSRAPALPEKQREEISKKLFEETQAKQKEEGYMKLKKVRERLPVFPSRDKFLETLAKNQVVVLTSETGSGKTTQVSKLFYFLYIYFYFHSIFTFHPFRFFFALFSLNSTLDFSL
jgi:RWD domain